MPIVIKFNNDLEFRKKVAFNRIYHSGNVKHRVAIELAIMAVSAIAAALVWFLGGGMANSTYIFYAFLIVTVIFLARFLRAVLVRSRIKPNNDPTRAQREFVFDENGFMFGPMNESGELISTRWGDMDRVYITGDVLYILCMSRKNWAAMDKRLIVSGEWEDLIKLVTDKLPKYKIYNLNKK